MQAYLDEFFYLFNRRGFDKTIFHHPVVRMVNYTPDYHKT
jgi:hypothetical protein